MKLNVLLICLLCLQLSQAAPSDDSKGGQQTHSVDPSTSGGSGLLKWLFTAPATALHGRQSAESRSSLERSSNLINPIRNFVTQASSAARNAFTGLRDRLSSTMTSITDYIVNGIPYAQESSKVPNAHIPEYAKGDPLRKSDNSGLSDRTLNLWNDEGKSSKNPEQVYQEFVDRLEGKSYYNTYYNLRDADLQYIKDYEQILENQKAAKKYKGDAINVLVALYRKLEEMVRHNKNYKN